jgi:SnoaL-like domain
MPASPAVAVARAHVAAWSNHDYDAARSGLAPDIEVTATSTDPALPDTALTGVDDYMRGLVAFAEPIVPGSLRVIGSVGDERNALLMLPRSCRAAPWARRRRSAGRGCTCSTTTARSRPSRSSSA